MENKARILAAEAFGTAVLVLGGLGTAVLAPAAGTVGVALAFGLSVLVAVYVVGPISGGQLNPAVTLALFLTRKIGAARAGFALLGQVVGAALGGFIIWSIGRGSEVFVRGNFGANGYGEHSAGGYGLGGVMVAEMVFTAVLVTVVLMMTNSKYSIPVAGAAAGLTVTIIHLVLGRVDGTSINPARSFAAAIFATGDSDALKQLWVFIVFPLIGAVIAVFLYLMLDDSTLEDTMLDNEALRDVRDIGDKAMDTVVDTLDG